MLVVTCASVCAFYLRTQAHPVFQKAVSITTPKSFEKVVDPWRAICRSKHLPASQMFVASTKTLGVQVIGVCHLWAQKGTWRGRMPNQGTIMRWQVLFFPARNIIGVAAMPIEVTQPQDASCRVPPRLPLASTL